MMYWRATDTCCRMKAHDWASLGSNKVQGIATHGTSRHHNHRNEVVRPGQVKVHSPLSSIEWMSLELHDGKDDPRFNFVAAETMGGPFVYQKYLINICKCKLCKIIIIM